MTIACYLRVSSEEQRKRETIGMQREQLERFALKHDLAIGDWYADDGITGTIPIDQRPEGKRLIADARAGRVRRVLVYKLDRLGRDALVTLGAIDALDQCGVEITSITQNLDLRTPHGKFMAVIDSGVSGYERDTLVERSKDGSARVARAGGWLGGRAPFGYRLTGSGMTARLVPSESAIPGLILSEAAVVREVYRLLADERRTCGYVARWMGEAGIPTPFVRDGRAVNSRGRPAAGAWTAVGIRNLIASPVYRGVQIYGKRKKDGREPIQNECTPLVSPETWDRAQAALTANRVKSSRNARREYELRGMIRCATCGASYVGCAKAGADGKEYRYYRCNGRGRGCAPLSADTLENSLWDRLANWGLEPESYIEQARAQIDADQQDGAAIRAEITRAQRAIDGLAAERDAILSLFRKGRIAESDFDRQFDKIDAEGRDLADRLAALKARAAAQNEEEARAETTRRILADLTGYIERAKTFDERRDLLAQCIDGITVTTTAPKEWTLAIVWAFDRLNPSIVTSAHGLACNNQPLRYVSRVTSRAA